MTRLERRDGWASVRQAWAAALRSASRRLADPGRALFATGMWTPWRIVGETLLSVVLGLLAAASEIPAGLVSGAGIVWVVAVGLAAALLSPLRRVLPATVLLLAATGMAEFVGLGPLLLVAAWSAGRRIDGVGRAAGAFAAAYVLSLGLSLLRASSPVLLTLAFAGPLLLVMIVVPA